MSEQITFLNREDSKKPLDEAIMALDRKGLSQQKIASKLNIMGMQKFNKGKKWTQAIVSRYMRNKLNIYREGKKTKVQPVPKTEENEAMKLVVELMTSNLTDESKLKIISYMVK